MAKKNPKPDAVPADVPAGMPYTLYFPRRGGFLAHDLEYAAPLPRVGDTVEYLDAQGVTRWYTVREVVHTVQDQLANSGAIPLLRAGVPAVFLSRARRRTT